MKLCITLVLLVSLFTAANTKITDSRIHRDARRLIPLAEGFGFADGGQLAFSIKGVRVYKSHITSPEPNVDRMGFILSSVDMEMAVEQEVDDDSMCILDIQDGNTLPRFSDSAIRKITGEDKPEQQATFDPFTIAQGGLFYLYFANCAKNEVSFDMHVEMYNFNSYGSKDYLSVGERELEAVYWVMFVLFAGITGFWCWHVYQNKVHAQRIHYLMGVLCLFKAMTVMSQALMVHYIERTGYADGWNVVFYVFTFMRGILFFTVIVLIGTGWSYMKPFLGDKEKRILMVVVPLQVFANIAVIVMDEESPAVVDWFTWRDVFHLVDIICCCAILFPIVWSIKNLRDASQTDGKAARSLEKLTLFRQFYIMVVVYIYFTRIVVYLLQSTLPYQYTWLSNAAEQLATLAFYVWTAVKFSPVESNPYLKLNTESEIGL